LLLGELILQANNLKALTTNIASVDGSLAAEVEHLLMSVRVIFNTRSCADHDSPGAVGSEDQNWVINSTELRVHYGLHFMPLVKFN